MRFAAYAGASVAAATAVIFHAFNQRPNFYSAVVYLAQSQACRMILLNLVVLLAYTFVRALQKALYGPLRAIEREQLWDKSWYAITETALAMTTFRDEVGAYFMVMFVSLLAGKIWAWISEGRVEILEQQPPANKTLFHARMCISLFISEAFDLAMLHYCINTLITQPRPGMMVMFAFEFAVLFITSSSITLRYALSVQEIFVVERQTKAKIEERRQEIRAANEEAQRQAAGDTDQAPPTLEREEDIDEHDIDVPGWEGKGKYILFLDLFTDFMKLIIYMFFFAMLILFHGIPIHIIRDVYLTTRSFVKRITDFQKYRNATKDMNARYPDATAQELERDGTCIICREDMHPWVPPQPAPTAGQAPQRPVRTPDERQRPKKLPCGHVLHLGCLKSWLERQQVCPTCRTSVLANNQSRGGPTDQVGGNAANLLRGAAGGDNGAPRNQQPHNPQHRADNGVRARQFRLGPWRFTFAAGEAANVRDTLRQLNQRQQAQNPALPFPQPPGQNNQRAAPEVASSQSTADMSTQISNMERQIHNEFARLQLTEQQLQGVRRLQNELTRVRIQQIGARANDLASQGAFQINASQQPAQPAFAVPPPLPYQHHTSPPDTTYGFQNPYAMPPTQLQRGNYPLPVQTVQFTALPAQASLGPGHTDLPTGLTLPEGWSLMPLTRTGPLRSERTLSGRERDPLGIGLPPIIPQTTVRAPIYSESQATSTETSHAPSTETASSSNHQPTVTVQSDLNGATIGQPSIETDSSASTSADTLNLPNWSSVGNEPAPEAQQDASTADNAQTDGAPEDDSTQAPSTIQSEGSNDQAFNSGAKGKGRAPRVEDMDVDAEGGPGSDTSLD